MMLGFKDMIENNLNFIIITGKLAKEPGLNKKKMK